MATYSNYRDRQLPFAFSYVVDIARYRHLLWNLVGSDLRSRFRRSRLGILWAIIQPLAFSLMLAAVWGSVFKDKNYQTFTIYVFSGMILWEYFTTAIIGGLDALINAGGYIQQSRIPFLIFQARVPITSTFIFCFGLIGLTIVMAAFQHLPPLGLPVIQLLAFIPLMIFILTPMTVLFSILGTQFRDTRYIMQLAVQAMFFITPVMLPRETLHSPALSWLAYANPAVPLLDMFRAATIYGQYWNQQQLFLVLAWGLGFWIMAISVSARFGRRIVFAL